MLGSKIDEDLQKLCMSLAGEHERSYDGRERSAHPGHSRYGEDMADGRWIVVAIYLLTISRR